MSITLSHAGLPVLKALKCQSSRKCVSIHPFHTDSISVSLMFNGASCVYYDLIIPNLKPTPQPLKTFIIYRRKEEKKKTNSAAARLKSAFFTAVSSPVLISLCVCTPWRVIPGWEMLTVFAAGYILWSFFFLFFFPLLKCSRKHSHEWSQAAMSAFQHSCMFYIWQAVSLNSVCSNRYGK